MLKPHPSPLRLSATALAQRTINTLSTAEQFLISALRLWFRAHGEDGACCCRSLLRNGFQAAGLLATEFEAFDRALTLIHAGHVGGVWIEPLHEPVISHGELRYLRILTCCQHDQVAQARRALAVWLPPAAVRIALPHLQHFAQACAHVNLTLTPGGLEAVSEESRPVVIALRAPSARLH
ncbi:MAG: hypothetical protein JNK21_05295 [Rhodospirillaceae bacterium]|nr:hypothetical protein [Rhodospirillaceae bacterium]